MENNDDKVSSEEKIRRLVAERRMRIDEMEALLEKDAELPDRAMHIPPSYIDLLRYLRIIRDVLVSTDRFLDYLEKRNAKIHSEDR